MYQDVVTNKNDVRIMKHLKTYEDYDRLDLVSVGDNVQVDVILPYEDPNGREGQFGEVKSIKNDGYIVVSFEDGVEGEYHYNYLLPKN